MTKHFKEDHDGTRYQVDLCTFKLDGEREYDDFEYMRLGVPYGVAVDFARDAIDVMATLDRLGVLDRSLGYSCDVRQDTEDGPTCYLRGFEYVHGNGIEGWEA